jgi:lipoate-protein ligase A
VRWRFLDSGALPGSEQMAIDAGLMDRARETGEAVLRVYAWTGPTLSFGRNEVARDRFSPATLQREGVSAVRRPTGGRVLLHDHEVTYSVTAPDSHAPTLAVGYLAINRLLRRALEHLGVAVDVAPAGRAIRPTGAPCFAEPSAGELVVEGRKLVGSAQLRERGAVLQHGSILLADDQPRIGTLSNSETPPVAPAATLLQALGRTPSYDQVRDALAAALNDESSHVSALNAAVAGKYACPHRAKFDDAEWTWRR